MAREAHRAKGNHGWESTPAAVIGTAGRQSLQGRRHLADAFGVSDLVRMACAELKIHAALEEEIFYPAAREKLDETSLVGEAQVEHAVLNQLIGELEEMTPDEEF